jgi:hypothetical protein
MSGSLKGIGLQILSYVGLCCGLGVFWLSHNGYIDPELQKVLLMAMTMVAVDSLIWPNGKP